MTKVLQDIWIVTYYENVKRDSDPIVTVFDNKDAAIQMHLYLQKKGAIEVMLEKSKLYNKVRIMDWEVQDGRCKTV